MSAETLSEWVRKGQIDLANGAETPYTVAARVIEEAEFAFEMEMLDAAVKAAPKDGRIALMLLERRHPERWGRKDQRQVTGRVDVLAQIQALVARPDAYGNEIVFGPNATVLPPLSEQAAIAAAERSIADAATPDDFEQDILSDDDTE